MCGRFTLTTTTEEVAAKFEVPDPPHIQQPLIQTMVNELLGKGTCASTGASAARASAVMDAALSRFYNGRDDEFWNRPETWGK